VANWTLAAIVLLLVIVVGVVVAVDGSGTATDRATASPSGAAPAFPSRSPGPFDDPALDLIETRLFGPGDADWSRFVADDGSFAVKAPGPAVRDELDDGGWSYSFGRYIVTPILYVWPVDEPIASPAGFARWTIDRWVEGRSIVDAPHPVTGTRGAVWQASVERDPYTDIYRATYAHDRLYVLAVSHRTRNAHAGELARRLVTTFVLDPHAIVG